MKYLSQVGQQAETTREGMKSAQVEDEESEAQPLERTNNQSAHFTSPHHASPHLSAHLRCNDATLS
jgi:hypothetical protein